MKMTRLIRWGAAVAACCCLMMCAVWDAAADGNSTNKTQKIDNVGFMKNSPKELVDRFPMCDAFLNVEWIDKERLFANSTVDLYFPGEKEIGIHNVGIVLDYGKLSPRYDYSSEMYENYIDGKTQIPVRVPTEKRKEFFNILEIGQIDRESVPTQLRVGDEILQLSYLSTYIYENNSRDDPYDYSLAQYKLTVCALYPDEKKVWIVEGKSPSEVYDGTTYSQMKNISVAELALTPYIQFLEWFDSSYIVDLNFDGRDDYYCGPLMMYSSGGAYTIPSFTHNRIHSRYSWNFPKYSGSCEVEYKNVFYLSSDGHDYFINDQCNLTRAILGD